MDKSSDDHKGDRKVADSREEQDTVQTSDSLTFSGSVTETSGAEDKPHAKYLGLRVQSGLLYSSHYSNITGFSVALARHGKSKHRDAFKVGAAVIPTTAESDLGGSIGDIFQLHLGYQHRWYSTPDYTWMGLFLLAGFNVKLMFWSYRNAVYSNVYDEDGNLIETDKVTTDGLPGLLVDLGCGWSMLQGKYFKASLELIAGGTLYSPSTLEGFNNDVFVADAYIKAVFEILLKLGL
jgi:hypothetical protein